MKLTGKAKEQFEKWYLKHSIRIQSNTNGILANIMAFYELNPMFQWGVYQDWADSLGYFITNSWINTDVFCPDITKDGLILWEDDFKTRQEARNAAIEKLNEIVNEG